MRLISFTILPERIDIGLFLFVLHDIILVIFVTVKRSNFVTIIKSKDKYGFRPRVCEICGKQDKPTHSKQKFCSDECKKQNHNENTLAFYYKKKGQAQNTTQASI